jgi:hypothetical protein
MPVFAIGTRDPFHAVEVQARVLALTRQYAQIHRVVVAFDLIAVMNNLARPQRPPNLLLSDDPMFMAPVALYVVPWLARMAARICPLSSCLRRGGSCAHLIGVSLESAPMRAELTAPSFLCRNIDSALALRAS